MKEKDSAMSMAMDQWNGSMKWINAQYFWQEQLAHLILENDTLSSKLTNTTFNSNDVIKYLKKTVEEKDGDVS